MPVVPVYQPQVNVPGISDRVPNFTGVSEPFVHSTTQIGRMLQARGERIIQEFDQTKALSAFNTYRSEARGVLQDLHSREGMTAYGVQDEFKKWDQDARQRLIKDSLGVHSQQQMFNELADRRAQADLDALASHEMRQHLVVKKETIDGLAGNTVIDIRMNADDEDAYQQRVGEFETALNAQFPGHDHTAAMQAKRMEFRTAQLEDIIDRDPKAAAMKLEEVKGELGENYYKLKHRLQAQLTDDKMSAAYAQLYTKFGRNYEAAMAAIMVPSNQQAMGLDFKEVNALHSRFSQLLSDRERSERMGEQAVKKEQDKWDSLALQSRFNPNAQKLDINELHKNRKISDSMYRYLSEAKESTQTDNPYTVVALQDKVERGIDITNDIAAAISGGQLSEKTAAAMGKHQVDEKSKRAMQYLDRALKPSEADKWSPDKHVKYADATRLYYAKIADGMDYEQAAYEVVRGYIDGIRRTFKGLPTPEGLSPDQKKDVPSLEAAKAALVEKYRNNRISANEYKEKMGTITSLLQLATEVQQADELDAAMEEVNRKRRQK